VVGLNDKLKTYTPYILFLGGCVLLIVCCLLLRSRNDNADGNGAESIIADYQRIADTQSTITSGIENSEKRAGAIADGIGNSTARIGTATDRIDAAISKLEAADARLGEGEQLIASIRRRAEEKAGSATENN
jgi:hypothetical protein